MIRVETHHIPELLAPAGGLDAMLAAVAAGADAVYAGPGAFNARVSAKGFEGDEFGRGVRFAHKHGVRVYATLNTFVFDREFADALELARRAHEAGVDAFIVADVGLASLLMREMPGVELHLSTQAGVNDPAGLRIAAQKLGVDRVCVARELSVDEIRKCCSVGVDVETFIHGAICISYSGACEYSALRRGRSAMRGDCTQPCRTSFDLVDEQGDSVVGVEGDKLICPRDYLGIGHLEELCEAGVAALKIEGRMKNPDYVYNVTRVYRQALDAIQDGRQYDDDALERQLGRSFNRGFTDAYLMGTSGAELMSFERSCNQGIRVGRLVACGHEEVSLTLEDDVSAGDTLEIRFYPGNDAPADVPKRWPQIPCPVDARAGETITLRCKRKVAPGSAVYLIRSGHVIDETQDVLARMYTELAALEDGAKVRGTDSADVVPSSTASGKPLGGAARNEGRTERESALGKTNASSQKEMPRRVGASSKRDVCCDFSDVFRAIQGNRAFDVMPPLFCANSESVRFYAGLGAQKIWLPAELSDDDVNELVLACRDIEVQLEHLPRENAQLMVMKHCVLTAEGPCSRSCETCRRRTRARYLVDLRDGALLPVRVDEHGSSRVFAPAAFRSSSDSL